MIFSSPRTGGTIIESTTIGALRHAEYVRDRVPVDVRVEHADALAALGERRREVRGEGRLADPALAGGDRDDPRPGIEPDLALGAAPTQPGRERRLLLGAHNVEVECDARHVRHATDVRRHLLLEAGAERAAGDREGDRHVHGSVRRDDHVPHHLELGDGSLELGVDHLLERLQDRVAVGGHRGQRSLSWMRDPRRKLAAFALGLPGAHEDFPWNERVVKVRGKVFVFLGPKDGGGTPAISVKLDESQSHALSVEGAEPTGHGLGKAGWVTVPVAGLPIARSATGSRRATASSHRSASSPSWTRAER